MSRDELAIARRRLPIETLKGIGSLLRAMASSSLDISKGVYINIKSVKIAAGNYAIARRRLPIETLKGSLVA
jgi:hypothetical protein